MWVNGGLLDRMLFTPLKVLYGTRFGSKHHMVVQLMLYKTSREAKSIL